MAPRVKKYKAALAAFIIVILVAAPQAQQAQQPPTQQAQAQPPQLMPAPGFATARAVTSPLPDMVSEIDLLVGRSTILNVGNTIARVSLTVPDVADAMVTAPTQLLIHGKQPGTISMFVWDRGGAIKTYEVNVRRDLTALVEYLKQLFPGEPIAVIGSGKDVVISGTVSSKYVIEKAADVAAGYVEKKENVVNLLKQQEGVASNQVMLRVRFAEVSRSAMQELGATMFANGYKSDWFGRTAPPGVPAPEFEDGQLVFSDFLNLFVFNAKEGLGAAVRALSNKGLFQSLAEPNLIATNGKEASFLAGGEYPYPVAQGGATNAVSIMFKEFGVRLSFTPTVLGGDLVHIKVKPEVSSLDFANAVIIDGFRVPALSTRRTETEVELRDGQTFAIAGLMNNTLTSSMSKIPGIGDIPILGHLFRSKAHQKNQTELVVMITPTIMRRGQTGVSEGLPSLVEPYLGAPNKVHQNPEPYVGSPRYPANGSRPSGGAANTPAPAPVAPVNLHPAASTGTNGAEPKGAFMPTEQPAQVATPEPQAPAAVPQVARPVTLPEPTKEEMKAIERQREEQRRADEAAAKQRAADAKRQAEIDRVNAKKAEEDRRAAEKLEKERAKRQAEVDKKNAELAKKKAEEDAKRDRVLAEAASRLKEAQDAYQAEVEKAKGSTNDKGKSSGQVRPPSTPRQ
jgi:pilus assembly protein CpaC